MILSIVGQLVPSGDQLLEHFGIPGLLASMWFWERQANAKRERQLDEAHQIIVAQRASIDALMKVIQSNTEALAKLAEKLGPDPGCHYDDRRHRAGG